MPVSVDVLEDLGPIHGICHLLERLTRLPPASQVGIIGRRDRHSLLVVCRQPRAGALRRLQVIRDVDQIDGKVLGVWLSLLGLEVGGAWRRGRGVGCS
jgi:hypothetical protein